MAAGKDKLRVLLINEQRTDREGYRLLQKQGKFRIIGEVKSASEALEIIDSRSPDFIVIEKGAKRSKSIDAIRRLKKNSPDVPIIVMSGENDEDFIARVLRAGASGYIIKQNIGQELTDAVLRIGSGQVYLSPLISKSISVILESQKPDRLLADYRHISPRMEAKDLTERQKEILKLLVQGLTNKQVAQQLNLSVKTVDAHRANIMNKLRIHGLPGLVKYAIRIGLTSIEE